MKSIKDKVEHMITLAQGGPILPIHAALAGLHHEDFDSSYLKFKSKKGKSKQ